MENNSTGQICTPGKEIQNTTYRPIGNERENVYSKFLLIKS